MPETPRHLIDSAINRVLAVEGGFSNHRSDPGGKTRFGITEAVARRHGYGGPMRSLPIEAARDIYRSDYWAPLRCDDVAEHSNAVAFELFEAGVNCGISRAASWLQESLNALNSRGRHWPDLAVDGRIGPLTLAALGKLAQRRGSDGMLVLLRALNVCQGRHYLELATVGSFEDFMFGWFLHRVALA